jgi:Holliday junction resolvase-like predicted endonuclease
LTPALDGLPDSRELAVVTMEKSSRHAKITGDFGEALVLYWLSRSGFECARVDHTGIDLIAKRPRSDERLGISVKTRSRLPGKEAESVNIGRPEDLVKVEAACCAFQCVPYFAIVVDAAQRISVFLVSKAHLDRLYPGRSGMISWSMTPGWLTKYLTDPQIESLGFSINSELW